ncbi:hypothetical protein QL285_081794 [Trifolium repens]|nr:hypothetical protein QL285_081794 [Trifolium repens]
MIPSAGALTTGYDVVTLHTTSCLRTCFTKMQPTLNSQQTPPLANFWLKQLEITQTSYKDTYITNTSSHQHKHTKEEKRSTSSKIVSKHTPSWKTLDQNCVVSLEHIRGMQQRKHRKLLRLK